MLTSSELVAIIAIWLLLLIGIFFGLRAAWRRRRNRGRRASLSSGPRSSA